MSGLDLFYRILNLIQFILFLLHLHPLPFNWFLFLDLLLLKPTVHRWSTTLHCHAIKVLLWTWNLFQGCFQLIRKILIVILFSLLVFLLFLFLLWKLTHFLILKLITIFFIFLLRTFLSVFFICLVGNTLIILI